ncbi:MAG: PfkB family carbohydrate kinase [Paracoccaceae bacterium]
MSVAPVLCIGSALWDVIAMASRQMNIGDDIAGSIQRRPGGVALNIAVALAAHGVTPTLLSTIGADSDGDTLIALLAAQGVDCTHVLRSFDPTGSYLAIESPGGDLFGAIADCAGLERAGDAVLAPATNGPLAPFSGEALVDGNLPVELLGRLHDLLPHASLSLVPASPGKADRMRRPIRRGHAAIYVNRGEAETICETAFGDSATAARALVAMGARFALVTNSAAPASLANAQHCVTCTPPQVNSISTTGAGDVVLAAHFAARQASPTPDSEAAMSAQLTAALTAAAAHITKANA